LNSPWKWILSVAGAATLVVTALLAHWSFQAKEDACRQAGRGLETTRDAAAEVVRSLLLEGGRALAGARPEREGEIPPTPFRSVGREAGPGQVTDVETFHVVDDGVDLWFEFRGDGIKLWRRTAPEQYLVGVIPIDVLDARLAADRRIGKPDPRRWSRLQLVDGAGDVVLERTDDARGKRRRRDRAAELVPDAHRAIRDGRPAKAFGDELPKPYKDSADKLAWGSWGPVFAESAPRLWTLVEVRDKEVVSGVGGFRIDLFDREFELLAWHVTLGIGLLLAIASAFLWLPARGGAEVTVLLRTYSFAKPYAWGIAFAVGVGAVYGASRAARAGVGKFMVDNVFVGQGSDEDKWNAIWWTVGMTLALGAITAVSNYFKEFLQSFYSTAMMADVRIAVARKIVGLPLSFFNRFRSGELLARIERDVTGMRAVLLQVFDKAFVAPFLLVASIVMAFYMNWELALVLFGLPFIVLPVFRIAKKVKKRASKRQDIAADISHVLFQMLSGIKVVKAFHGEERESARLVAANRRYIHEARRIARLMAFSESLLDFLQMVGGAIVVYLGGRGVISGTVQLGELIGFLFVILSIYDAAKDIAAVLNKMTDALPAVSRVYEILDTENDLEDGPREAPKGPLLRGIELRGVSFSYVDNEILKDVDLFVPAGKVVAIVGPTGAGKTTLCDLVARFYDPTAGSVLWDGVDAREFTTSSLASKLAIVTQEAFLFNAPLDENIRYGREDATADEVVAAAKDANVHDEIVKMEGGYGKQAGERGSALSGGQRQRITIARALIKDAPVLILDEATSNLDTESEQLVQQALAKLMEHRTVIVVAHRLSTIRNADKVVVVDGGRIVEEGAPEDLLKLPGGRFRQMCELQTGERPPDDDGAAAAV
jgi:subfamily B ATP-binding cassette protein MsbA